MHPQFNPVALDLTRFGLPLQVHWYGITYLVAFALFLWLASRRAALPWFASQGWNRREVEDLLFYGVAGGVLGGRLGYVLFYKPGYYLAHPLEVLAVWKGGMSFHGGFLGVALALVLFAWQRKRSFLNVADLVAPCAPTGLASGRIGNFINGELWGRAADPALPWAMVFPQSGTMTPRHPSQLYQFAMEGLLLFVLLWWYGRQQRAPGRVAAAFLTGYGMFRFIAEYFREPDDFLGPLALGLSMGQWLSVPMILAGAAWWWWAGATVGSPGMRQIFLDTETTGLSPENGDRIVEIGCVEMDNRRLTGRHLHFYLNPQRKGSEDAIRIHGLTDEFLADKPLFAAIADELLAFVADAEIIIHNAGFDVGFLDEELRRAGRPPFAQHVAAITDSLTMAREMFPGKANSLDALCRRLEVDNSNRTLHGALLDAGLLAEVYIHMTRGQDSLVIDGAESAAEQALSVSDVDLRAFALPILEPDEDEARAHQSALAELDKSSGGKTLWRALASDSLAAPLVAQ